MERSRPPVPPGVRVALPEGAPRDALGALPPQLELVAVPPAGAVPAAAAGAEVLVVGDGLERRLGDLFPRMQGLRLVQTVYAGIEWLLARVPPGVTVCNASGVHDGPVAEWVVGAILAMERRFLHFSERQRAGTWAEDPDRGEIDDLDGRTVLVLGHGSIGRALEERLLPFGARVVGVARRARPGAHEPSALPELLPHADVVVLLLPLTPETEGIVDERFLQLMKDGALLVNAARGGLVDTDALVAALAARRVRAALDVTDPEPLPAGHALWRAPGVLITPHVAGASKRWRERAYVFVGDQLRRYAAGEPLLNVRSDY